VSPAEKLKVVTPTEQKIIDLSAKGTAMKDSDAIEPATEELRAAIHEHVSNVRDKVAELAFVVAKESESKAA
jgi:hypothetical protein